MKSKNALRVVSGVMLSTLAACAAVSGLDQLQKVDCLGDCTDAGLDSTSDGSSPAADAGTDALVEGGSLLDQSVPEGGPDDAEADADDATPPADGGIDTGVDATPPTDAAPPPDAGCSGVVVDVNVGVFVATTGADGASCGTLAAPCRTVAAGVSVASGSGTRKTVYIAAGTYTEAVSLPNAVALVGGWHVAAGAWSFDCSATPSSVVTLQAPANSNVTLTADTTEGASVSTLSVRSKATANTSESIFGIVARGAGTTLALNDVTLQVANGGDGQTGTTGSGGSSPGAGSCLPGNGSAGSTPAIGGGASAGTFGANGYTAQGGGSGSNGASGNNGTGAPGGQSVTYSTCASIVVVGCNSGSSNCQSGAGSNGCGASGGGGGGGGSGGGSSVGVFAVNGAQVTISAGSYRSGNGGRGGAGGAGGSGGSGSLGAAGSPKTCTDVAKCQGIVCNNQPDVVAPGGAPGGTGGAGGTGSAGGGGSGGSSYALLSGLGATITVAGTPALTSGSAGGSASNGSAGASGTRGTF